MCHGLKLMYMLAAPTQSDYKSTGVCKEGCTQFQKEAMEAEDIQSTCTAKTNGFVGLWSVLAHGDVGICYERRFNKVCNDEKEKM